MFGVLQLAGATSNECGEGTELAVDRVSGGLLNCDGSPFEGRGGPGGGVDYAALGEQVYTGQVVPAANCAGCHGAQGQGGAGPPFATVVATFSSCLDHVEWVSKGTMGFQAEGRTTYGDLNKPVGGVGNMPGFGTSLTAEQIAAAAAFERVRFGGADPAQALIDCGLAEAPGEEAEGEAPAEGAPAEGAPAEGGASSTTAAP
jgi:mono/diheme cytochrome c family protein